MADFIYNNNYILSNLDAQKLYAQSPLTTGVSGTSAYIGIEPSAQYNETVLFDNGTSGTSAGLLSENKTNFDYLKVYVGVGGGYNSLDGVSILNVPSDENVSATWLEYCFGGGTNAYMAAARLEWTSQNTFQINYGTSLQRPVGTTAVNGNTAYNDNVRKCVSRIIGINRKENV